MAFYHAREKFRLDLFEKRWEIYVGTQKVLSSLKSELNQKTEQEVIEKIWENAEQAFRHIGWHKANLLFDKDITSLLEEINKIFSEMTTLYKVPDQRYFDNHTKILRIVEDLPKTFSSTMYFGNYKV
jgi:hypothetical protein